LHCHNKRAKEINRIAKMVNQDAVVVSAAAAAAKEAAPGGVTVVVHPLVLLSVVDHYNRVAKDTKKRAVGVLLGSGSTSR
jgi:hypothetical protein